MGPLSSGQLRPAAAALVSVRDLATDQQLLPVCSSSSGQPLTVDSFNCELLISLYS